MSALNAYLALCAASARKAIPKATRRHVYIADRPMVIVGYHLAGDPGAPLALMWGTDPEQAPKTVVVPEPRNRDLRFKALAHFGADFLNYLDNFADPVLDTVRGGQNDFVCEEAPQILVPNQATADWLFGIVGRFTRHLQSKPGQPIPEAVPRAGRYLSFFHQPIPGSSLVLAATDLLSGHWQTGQLPSEDLNLSALLSWIEPPPGSDGPTAARAAELLPPAGPLSDPNWDAQVFAELVGHWRDASTDTERATVRDELDIEIRAQLEHSWTACWQARRLLAGLPEADSVAGRWERDRIDWTRQRAAVEAGTARYRNIPTPVQAARTLWFLEQRTTDLEADMALDDPLMMAGYVTSGEAVTGRVIAVDKDRMIQGPKRRVRRPLVTIEPFLPFTRPVGTVLFLAAAPEVELEVVGHINGTVLLQVNRGAVLPRNFGRLPSPEDEVTVSPFGKRDRYPMPQYADVPWTHRMPETMEGQQL